MVDMNPLESSFRSVSFVERRNQGERHPVVRLPHELPLHWERPRRTASAVGRKPLPEPRTQTEANFMLHGGEDMGGVSAIIKRIWRSGIVGKAFIIVVGGVVLSVAAGMVLVSVL
ncbi:MAG: hypothetical protein KGI73_04315 [Patescibacteria group bacterium]|nr:hypothetical protein [Patescibacteria group bacterium]